MMPCRCSFSIQKTVCASSGSKKHRSASEWRQPSSRTSAFPGNGFFMPFFTGDGFAAPPAPFSAAAPVSCSLEKSAPHAMEKPYSPALVLRLGGKCFIFRTCLLTTSAYLPGQEREETGSSVSAGPNSCPRAARTAATAATAEASFWRWTRIRMTCAPFSMIPN